MATSWRLLAVCVLAAVPVLAGNELWYVVQGIAPSMEEAERRRLYSGWKSAVRRARLIMEEGS